MYRSCIICGMGCKLDTITWHEFDCYKKQPLRVPSFHFKDFIHYLELEKKQAVEDDLEIKRREWQ